MKSIDLYNGLLDSLGLPRDEKGQVLKCVGGEPITIAKKKLIALSQEVLDTNEWEGKIAFHPLSEDILMGQSPIIHFLQRAVRVRLINLVVTCMSDLLEIACSPELQASAGDPDVAKYLEAARFAKAESTPAAWVKVMKRISNPVTGDDVPLKVYLSRETALSDGVKYPRVCTIAVPMLEGKDEDDQMFWGIKLKSKADKRTLVGLLETILGDELEFGSKSCAPYFHALMTAYVTIAKRIDKIQRCMKKVNKWKSMSFTWAKQLDDLESIEREIPPLDGNQGAIIKRQAPVIDDEEVAEAGIATTRVAARLDDLDIPEKDDDRVPWNTTDEKRPLGTPPVAGIGLSRLLGGNKGNERRDRDDDRDYDRRDRRRDRDDDDRDYRRRDRDDDRDYRRRDRDDDRRDRRRDRDDDDRDYDRRDDRRVRRGATLSDLLGTRRR